jgi:hypothetical protein
VVTGLGFRPARFQRERERERDVERDRDRETEVIPKEIFRERERGPDGRLGFLLWFG